MIELEPETGDVGVVGKIEKAIDLRRRLFDPSKTDAYRLFHGFGEGLIGVTIDRWGSAIRIEATALETTLKSEIVQALMPLRPSSIILRIKGQDPVVLFGNGVAATTVTENGVRYRVAPMHRGNPGLYLDARPAREWLRRHSQDRRILNLFASTGSLGLCASVGGARSVSHVDTQRSALRRIRENYQLNGLQIDDRDLLRLNLYRHLRKKSARRRLYDGIVIDAPPYQPRSDRTPGVRGVFGLAKTTLAMLDDDGWMLCFFHHMREATSVLEERIVEATEGRLVVEWRGRSGGDFPEHDERNASRMIALRHRSCETPLSPG